MAKLPTQEWMRDALKAEGLKLKDVAEALGVAPPRVSDILKGSREVQADEVMPLSELLGMSPQSLLRSLALGERTLVPGTGTTSLPILGQLAGDGTLTDLPADLGFDTVPCPPDVSRSDGLYCYMLADGSMAREIRAGSLVIAADPKLHYAAIAPGAILLVKTAEGTRLLRQYVRTDAGEDWLVPLPETPNPAYASLRLSLLPGGLGPRTEGGTLRAEDIVGVVLWVHSRIGQKA
ncbi:helix-turn-helix transcriptional regulator [Kordiimonas marina]|uniref:helix-turn-helix transcriptional regulator n=1 Tax=Kordiimonas marina TaxID=2872312 RepID=UPI001FF5B0B6|nr:helix-turn-helix transcriptional regulator [Kordiimonas marina]MCJ9428667.1 helix-turn-helix domain-containing protein [Kordiimonas marina]